MYKELADYNGDIVFVKCLSIWYSKIEKIPTDKTFNLDFLKVVYIFKKLYILSNISLLIFFFSNVDEFYTSLFYILLDYRKCYTKWISQKFNNNNNICSRINLVKHSHNGDNKKLFLNVRV